jgi:hypothetical protein
LRSFLLVLSTRARCLYFVASGRPNCRTFAKIILKYFVVVYVDGTDLDRTECVHPCSRSSTSMLATVTALYNAACQVRVEDLHQSLTAFREKPPHSSGDLERCIATVHVLNERHAARYRKRFDVVALAHGVAAKQHGAGYHMACATLGASVFDRAVPAALQRGGTAAQDQENIAAVNRLHVNGAKDLTSSVPPIAPEEASALADLAILCLRSAVLADDDELTQRHLRAVSVAVKRFAAATADHQSSGARVGYYLSHAVQALLRFRRSADGHVSLPTASRTIAFLNAFGETMQADFQRFLRSPHGAQTQRALVAALVGLTARAYASLTCAASETTPLCVRYGGGASSASALVELLSRSISFIDLDVASLFRLAASLQTQQLERQQEISSILHCNTRILTFLSREDSEFIETVEEFAKSIAQVEAALHRIAAASYGASDMSTCVHALTLRGAMARYRGDAVTATQSLLTAASATLVLASGEEQTAAVNDIIQRVPAVGSALMPEILQALKSAALQSCRKPSDSVRHRLAFAARTLQKSTPADAADRMLARACCVGRAVAAYRCALSGQSEGAATWDCALAREVLLALDPVVNVGSTVAVAADFDLPMLVDALSLASIAFVSSGDVHAGKLLAVKSAAYALSLPAATTAPRCLIAAGTAIRFYNAACTKRFELGMLRKMRTISRCQDPPCDVVPYAQLTVAAGMNSLPQPRPSGRTSAEARPTHLLQAPPRRTSTAMTSHHRHHRREWFVEDEARALRSAYSLLDASAASASCSCNVSRWLSVCDGALASALGASQRGSGTLPWLRPDLVVVSVTPSADGRFLLITRQSSEVDACGSFAVPLVLDHRNALEAAVEELSAILRCNGDDVAATSDSLRLAPSTDSLQSDDSSNGNGTAAPYRRGTKAEKEHWWSARKSIDQRIASLCRDADETLLGPCGRGLLMGGYANADARQRHAELTRDTCAALRRWLASLSDDERVDAVSLHADDVESQWSQQLVSATLLAAVTAPTLQMSGAWTVLAAPSVVDGLCSFLRIDRDALSVDSWKSFEGLAQRAAADATAIAVNELHSGASGTAEVLERQTTAGRAECLRSRVARQHVLLVLEGLTQRLPWEATHSLQGLRCSRVPGYRLRASCSLPIRASSSQSRGYRPHARCVRC